MSGLINAATSQALWRIYEQKLDEERERGVLTWPSRKYEHDPIGFCVDILGYAPTAFQAECIIAIANDDKIVIRSGRKLGKSRIQASAALWHYCTFEDATAVLVAPTEGQIERIVWHDLQTLHSQSGRCLSCRLRDPSGPRPCPHSACIDGEPSPSCRAGMQVGPRRIFGMAPRNADHMRGISGPHQLYLLDESPGIDQEIYEACVGNVAATGRTVAAFGNPSQRFGWFFDAHMRPGAFRRIVGSSLDSPNVRLARRIVEGLADTKWIEQMRAELSEDDPRWQVDVLGEFPSRDMLRVIDDTALARVFARAEGGGDGKGDLYFGIDCAGGTGGDDSVIAMRRGYRFAPLLGFQGDTDRIMLELHELLRVHRKGTEPVHINYDAAGRYGKDLGIALGQLRQKDENIVARGLDGRGDASRDAMLATSGYSRPKDCYWGNAAQLMKTVVAIPFHEKLKEDFTFAEWMKDNRDRDRLKDVKKTEQRKATGRSPDFGDAVAYCLWEGRVVPLSEISAEVAASREIDREQDLQQMRPKVNDVHEEVSDEVFDPFEGASGGRSWR